MALLKSTNVIGNLSATGNIIASKIMLNGGDNNSLLLAGGNTKLISDFATSAQMTAANTSINNLSSGKVNKSGDTMTGCLRLGRSTQDGMTDAVGISIQDLRNTTLNGNTFGNFAANFIFSNQLGTNDWRSALHMHGWHDGYAAWQLSGGGSTTVANTLYYREGIDDNLASATWYSIPFENRNNTFSGINTFSGQVIISNTTDAALTSASGALRIGDINGEHIAIDGNEIMAKATASTANTLYLNNEGGLVQIGSGGLSVGGNITPSTNNSKTLGTSSLKWSNVYATTFTGALSGNADSATKWATDRTLTIGATGKSVNGTANVTWTPYEMRVTRAQYNVGSNMNQIADHGCELGMTSLTGTDTTINPGGGTDWHHYINMTWSDTSDNNSITTNEWCTQIANKVGTTDLWVRSRKGGSIANGTAWAAPWTRILTGSNWTSVVDGRYLKLAGGTMTGKLTANQGLECTNIDWVPSGNISCVPTAHNNEWSFDIYDSTYTNAMWHVYSLKAQSSILQCIADPEYKVNIPHGKLGLGSAIFKYNTSDKCIDVIFN